MCVACPPENATPGAYCACCGKPARVPDAQTQYAGGYSARGFVRNERFARAGDQVIPGTNRDVTRKWRRSAEGKGA
jgi:hypothetical protein